MKNTWKYLKNRKNRKYLKKTHLCVYNKYYWARIYFSRHCIKFSVWFMFWVQIWSQMRSFSPSSPFSFISPFAFISNDEWLFCSWRYFCCDSSELSRSSLHLVCHLMTHLCVCVPAVVGGSGVGRDLKPIFYQMHLLWKSTAGSPESRRKESGSFCIFNEIPQRVKEVQVRKKK